MNKVFFKVAAAAIALVTVSYGAYKLYNRYCGAKIAKQNKFRNKFEDVGYNFEDEYLEDDDVYYFGNVPSEGTESGKNFFEEITEKIDEMEQEIIDIEASANDDISIEDFLGSSAE